jgi:hypothetical protein
MKFRFNPQHANVVLNECLGTHIAHCIGLNVPRFSLMSATHLENTETESTAERPDSNRSQIHFASSFVGYAPFGKTVDCLPTVDLRRMWNPKEFAGILALDLWLSNTDVRQAVFMQEGRSRRFRAYWIDFGYCLGDNSLGQASRRGASLYRNSTCYDFIHSLLDFDPWLSAIEDLSIPKLQAFLHSLPWSWRAGNEEALETSFIQLSKRQATLRNDLQRFVQNRPEIFVGWNVSLDICA